MADGSIEPIEGVSNKKKAINLPYENMLLAEKMDALFTDKIEAQAKKLEEDATTQKALLAFKMCIANHPPISSTSSLSEEALSLKDKLHQKHNIEFTATTLKEFEAETETKIEEIKLTSQKILNKMSSLNNIRVELLHAFKLAIQNDPRNTMVRNQK